MRQRTEEHNTRVTKPLAQRVKNLPAMQEPWVWSLGQEDPLGKGMATHYSILAWRISQTEERGGLQSLGSQRVGCNQHTHKIKARKPMKSTDPKYSKFACSSKLPSRLPPHAYHPLKETLSESLSPVPTPSAHLLWPQPNPREWLSVRKREVGPTIMPSIWSLSS